MPAHDFIKQYCDYLSDQKRYSPNTVVSYFNDLEALKKYVKKEYEISDLTRVSNQVLRSWLSSMKEERLESRSINRKLSAARSFYKYLLRLQIIAQSPAETIRSLKTGKDLPVFLEYDQVRLLLNRSFFPEGFDGDTDFLIISVLYFTGMRVSELASLKVSDIGLSAGIISVVGKGNKQRNIPMNDDLANLIKRYSEQKKRFFEVPENILVVDENNKKLSRVDIYNRVHRMLSEVTTIQKKSPHVLRHTFATHLSDQGAPIGAIKDLLGHSSLAATQIYTHTGISRLKEIYKKAHPKA